MTTEPAGHSLPAFSPDRSGPDDLMDRLRRWDAQTLAAARATVVT